MPELGPGVSRGLLSSFLCCERGRTRGGLGQGALMLEGGGRDSTSLEGHLVWAPPTPAGTPQRSRHFSPEKVNNQPPADALGDARDEVTLTSGGHFAR